MNASFHTGNRKRLYEAMKPASLLVMFSGEDVRKTNDEYYPFYTDRNFYYLTGLDQHELVLMAVKEPSGNVHEQIYILPPDLMAERWTGARLKPAEVEALSGISDVRFVDQFQTDFHALAAGGHYSLTSGQIAQVYLDLFRVSPQDIDRPAHRLLKQIQANYPYLQVENANAILRRLRLIKQPCEIDAIRQAEKVTGEGIMAMMKASRPGMYEYQYKAEFDYALTQHGPQGPAFPSIISAGKNNFCIHYYSYRGQAHDGDMVLNDVGAQLVDGVVDGFQQGGAVVALAQGDGNVGGILSLGHDLKVGIRMDVQVIVEGDIRIQGGINASGSQQLDGFLQGVDALHGGTVALSQGFSRTMARTTTTMWTARASAAMTAAWRLLRHEL